MAALRELVDDNLKGAAVVAVGVHLMVSALVASVVATGTSQPDEVDLRYREVARVVPPRDYAPQLSFSVLGRRVTTFEQFNGASMLLLYSEGRIAGRTTEAARLRMVDDLMRIVEVPAERIDELEGRVGHADVTIRRFLVGVQPPLQVSVAPFTATNGDTCLLVIAGFPDEVAEQEQEVFDVL